MTSNISKKSKSEKSDLIRELELDERKRFGIPHKVTKRTKVFWTPSYFDSDDARVVIVLDIKWKKYFSRPPNFKVQNINGKLSLQSDIKIRTRRSM